MDSWIFYGYMDYSMISNPFQIHVLAVVHNDIHSKFIQKIDLWI